MTYFRRIGEYGATSNCTPTDSVSSHHCSSLLWMLALGVPQWLVLDTTLKVTLGGLELLDPPPILPNDVMSVFSHPTTLLSC